MLMIQLMVAQPFNDSTLLKLAFKAGTEQISVQFDSSSTSD